MSLLRKFRGKDTSGFLVPPFDPFFIDNFLFNDSFTNQIKPMRDKWAIDQSIMGLCPYTIIVIVIMYHKATPETVTKSND